MWWTKLANCQLFTAR